MNQTKYFNKFSTPCFASMYKQTLSPEPNRRVYIFDMDGTLYQFDGKNKGYTGSTLETTVLANAIDFVQKYLSLSPTQAQKIIKWANKNSIGISQYLQQNYDIPRETYFGQVWNIDPTNIVRNYQAGIQALNTLKSKRSSAKFILLTSAPLIWQQQVIKFLEEQGLNKIFDICITGSNFNTKQVVFCRLASYFNPKNIVSVGDQYKTDIKPASKLGCQTLLVKKPTDIFLILKPEKND